MTIDCIGIGRIAVGMMRFIRRNTVLLLGCWVHENETNGALQQTEVGPPIVGTTLL